MFKKLGEAVFSFSKPMVDAGDQVVTLKVDSHSISYYSLKHLYLMRSKRYWSVIICMGSTIFLVHRKDKLFFVKGWDYSRLK